MQIDAKRRRKMDKAAAENMVNNLTPELKRALKVSSGLQRGSQLYLHPIMAIPFINVHLEMLYA